VVNSYRVTFTEMRERDGRRVMLVARSVEVAALSLEQAERAARVHLRMEHPGVEFEWRSTALVRDSIGGHGGRAVVLVENELDLGDET